MRRQQSWVLGLVVIFSACTNSSNSQYQKGLKSSNVDRSDAYLLDMADAAGDDQARISVEVGSSVTPDLEDSRLNKMATRFLEFADKDKSGALSLEEFLEGPKALRKYHEDELGEGPSAAHQEKIKAHLTEDFEEFAGEDSQLDKDELIALLVRNAPLVFHHRKRGHGHGDGGGHRPPRDMAGGEQAGEGQPGQGPAAWEQIIAKYDKNADGMLSKDEFEAFRADRHHGRGPRPGPEGTR